MARTRTSIEKIAWSGRIVAVQPRIRLIMRSFDERHHSYQGYVLRIDETCGDRRDEFQIAIGKAAHEKHRFRTGMEVSGVAVPVPDPRLETAEFYKASGLKVLKNAEGEPLSDPPFHGVPPDLGPGTTIRAFIRSVMPIQTASCSSSKFSKSSGNFKKPITV